MISVCNVAILHLYRRLQKKKKRKKSQPQKPNPVIALQTDCHCGKNNLHRFASPKSQIMWKFTSNYLTFKFNNGTHMMANEDKNTQVRKI